MSEFKGTRGGAEITRCQISERISVTSGLFQIAEVFSYDVLCGNNDTKEALANAKLIIDAFKVRQSINCELSELLEQRNEMLAMLDELYEDVECWLDISSYGYGNKIEQLIKKVKDNE
jgi:hypothetical protein